MASTTVAPLYPVEQIEEAIYCGIYDDPPFADERRVVESSRDCSAVYDLPPPGALDVGEYGEVGNVAEEGIYLCADA